MMIDCTQDTPESLFSNLLWRYQIPHLQISMNGGGLQGMYAQQAGFVDRYWILMEFGFSACYFTAVSRGGETP
jgi:hypothetical protein